MALIPGLAPVGALTQPLVGRADWSTNALSVARYLSAGYLTAAFGSYVGLHLNSGPPDALGSLQYAVAGLACILMLWRPTLGATLGLTTLVLPLLDGPTGADLPVLFVAAIVIAAVARRLPAGVLLAIYAGFVIAVGVRFGPELLTIYAVTLAVAVAVGSTVRALWIIADRRRASIVRLRADTDSAAARERERLASEVEATLRRRLASMLADAALSGDADGAAPLRRALSTIDASARGALNDLRRLIGVLRTTAPPEATRHRASVLQPARGTATVALLGLGFGVALRAVTSPDTGHVAAIVCIVATLVLIWRGEVGLPVAGAAALVTLAIGTDPAPLVLLLAASAAWAAVRGQAGLRVGLGVGTVLGVWLVRHPATAHFDGWTTVTVCAMAVVAALTWRHFAEHRRADATAIVTLEARRTLAGQRERALLARELHDVVAHQLSVVSLHVLGHADSDDPSELRTALDSVASALRTAGLELDLLVTALAEPAAADAAALLAPRAAASALERTLRAHGHAPVCRLGASVDSLDVQVRHAVVRILQEGGTNALRHADPGPCLVSVEESSDSVRVRVVSTLPAQHRESPLSTGWGLRGLRERVTLLGGTLDAGPQGGSWVLEATLPLDPIGSRAGRPA